MNVLTPNETLCGTAETKREISYQLAALRAAPRLPDALRSPLIDREDREAAVQASVRQPLSGVNYFAFRDEIGLLDAVDLSALQRPRSAKETDPATAFYLQNLCIGSAAPAMPERRAITTGSHEGVLEASGRTSAGRRDACHR